MFHLRFGTDREDNENGKGFNPLYNVLQGPTTVLDQWLGHRRMVMDQGRESQKDCSV